ncbi:hypothetical protein PP242_gp42 [Streptococcus phage P7602]|uniref:Uncharacterized protein n=1 Tax=Streptococcus phage P7602 TaxID=1971432 RepID=A0A286QRQ1_9CAUD|nr:hypothetical protein PP242_gp42 [Streptococcus phage P7602]ARU14034.1 hypothetical protein P7602_42 [Streptococcus phage P7602]
MDRKLRQGIDRRETNRRSRTNVHSHSNLHR